MSAREVTLLGGSPWGFRMHGGHDLHQPLRISRVNPGSKAAQQGVREGDLISVINGKSTRELTNSEAHGLLKTAGDSLKLGLNQESSIASPKKRIYKSSLQENTSTETLKKVTTKTITTSSTKIISTEPKKNGTTDDAKEDESYVKQNGGPRNEISSQVSGRESKNEYRDCYATDSEELAMPHGARSRRNRRNRQNRNRRRFPRPSTPDGALINDRRDENSPRDNYECVETNECSTSVTNDSNLENNVDDASNTGSDVARFVEPLLPENTASSRRKSRSKSARDVKSNNEADIVEVTARNKEIEINERNVEEFKVEKKIKWSDEATETVDDSPRTEKLQEKQKIRKGILKAETKLVEITVIESLPLEAKIDHIPGVGILEIGHTNEHSNDTSIMTISEPVESIKPLSSSLTSKVELFGDVNDATKILANGEDRLEIHEVSDSEADSDAVRYIPIVTETESDVEKESVDNREQSELICPSEINSNRVSLDNSESDEETSTEDLDRCTSNLELQVNEDSMSVEVEENLRNFIRDLKLPTSPEENREENEEMEGKNVNIGYHAKTNNRTLLQSYFTQAQTTSRFLDIIQEEGEKMSEDDEQHIRDFINGEISKYRRDDRRCNRNELNLSESKSIIPFVCKVEDLSEGKVLQEFGIEVIKEDVNIDESDKGEMEKNFFDKCESSVSISGDVSILSSDETRHRVAPTPPKRSSSFDRETADPPRPPTSTEIEISYEQHGGRGSPIRKRGTEPPEEPPKRPPPPSISEDSRGRVTVDAFTSDSFTMLRNDDATVLGNGARPQIDREKATEKFAASYQPATSTTDSLSGPLSASVESSAENLSNVSEDSDCEISSKNKNLLEEPSVECKIEYPEILRDTDIEIIEEKIEFSENSCDPSNSEDRQTDCNTCAALSPNDNQAHDSSSSAASVATIRHNPTRSSIGDIALLTQEDAIAEAENRERSKLKNKLALLKCDRKTASDDEAPESPQLIPYSPIEDLYYVPLVGTTSLRDFDERKIDRSLHQPESLKNLCIKKILSMPFGLRVINEITVPTFNIFRTLKTIQEFANEANVRASNDGFNAHAVVREERVAPNTQISTGDKDPECFKTDVSVRRYEDKLKSDEKQADDIANYEIQSSEEKMSKFSRHRPKTWIGVPTSEDPNLLVCLSPSQQEAPVRASVDNLLDLHEKYLNRHSYHGDAPSKVLPRKYYIDLESSALKPEEAKNDYRNAVSTNRLMDIIKENSNEARKTETERAPFNEPSRSNAEFAMRGSEFNARQERLKTTRLGEWLSLARRDPVYSASRYSTRFMPDDLLIEPGSDGKHGKEDKPNSNTVRESAVSVKDSRVSAGVSRSDELKKNEESRNVESITVTRVRKLEDNVGNVIADKSTGAFDIDETAQRRNFNASMNDKALEDFREENNINAIEKANDSPLGRSALIVRSIDDDNSLSFTQTPFRKSPLTLNSAIIDKSASPTNFECRSIRRKIDSRHNVNPALIDDKPQVPPKCKRNIKVDKSCIDQTSIFDRAPPRCYLEPRRHREAEDLKLDAANEIMDNLKRLQNERSSFRETNRRYSLPQKYFEKQLNYIEQLENQLENVLIAEEEERRAFEEFQTHAHSESEFRKHVGKTFNAFEREFSRQSQKPNTSSMERDENTETQKEKWQEKSKNIEKDRSESVSKEGSREVTKKKIDENGLREEESCEKIERKEVRCTMTKNDGNRPATSAASAGASAAATAKEESPNEYKSENYEKKQTSNERPIGAALVTSGEAFRRQMYDEYVHKVMEREERKHNRVVKISTHSDIKGPRNEASPNSVEKEFIEKAKNRLSKFGISLDENEAKKIASGETIDANDMTKAKCVIDGKEIDDARKLPKHLQEFLRISTATEDQEGSGYAKTVRRKPNESDLLHEIIGASNISKGFLLGKETVMFAPTFKASSAKPGVWSPGTEPPPPPKQPSPDRSKSEKNGSIPPVWTPGNSPVPERKEFRPVQFESPILSRKKLQTEQTAQAPPPWEENSKKESIESIEQTLSTRIVNSHSAPSQGLSSLTSAPRLPRAQNPTITLLQKAREGQLPKGAAYLEEGETASRLQSDEKPLISPGEIIYTVKKEYESEPETEHERPKKMADLGPRKFEGIGPTTRDGVPLVLRSEVKENNQAKWYKKMYDSLHRADRDDDYVTIRYKPRRATRYGYGSSSGYLSEPEQYVYSERSATFDSRRRQRAKENDFSTSTLPRKSGQLKYSPEIYKNQPGRIEDYEPGRSSIADKEAKEWWDEVMDIFDGWLDENGQGGTIIHDGNPEGRRRVLSLSYRPDSSHSVRIPPICGMKSLEVGASTFHRVHERAGSIDRHLNKTSRVEQHKPNRDPRPQRPSDLAVNVHQKSVRKIDNNTKIDNLTRQLSSARPSDDNLDRCVRVMQANKANLALHLQKSMPEKMDKILSPDARKIETIPPETQSLVESKENGETTKNQDARREIGKDPHEGIIKPLEKSPERPWHMLDGKSKSFVLPDRRDDRSRLPSTPTSVNRHYRYHHNHHHHHHHHHQHQHQRTAPITSSSSSTSASSLSSTTHIMLPLPSPTSPTAASIDARAMSSLPFDQRNTPTQRPYMSHAFKESGYESDSTLVFRRREDVSPLSPLEQRLAYKTVQRGGDVPLHGLRKPAPERPKEDTQIEYFPISPTLTRIRVHRRNATIPGLRSSSSSEILPRYEDTAFTSSSVSDSASMRTDLASYGEKSNPPLTTVSPPGERTASLICFGRPPSPPRRKSSRNNKTLKLYSSKCTVQQSTNPRHEQCFIADSVSNIRRLRERLNSNIEKHKREREIYQSGQISRASSASPVSCRGKLPAKVIPEKRKSEPCLIRSFSESTSNELAPASNRIKPRVPFTSGFPIRISKNIVKKVDSKQSRDRWSSGKIIPRSVVKSAAKDKSTRDYTPTINSKLRTTKSRLTRKEQEQSCKRLTRSTDHLCSPLEIKRAVQKQEDKGIRVSQGKIRQTSSLCIPVLGGKRISHEKIQNNITDDDKCRQPVLLLRNITNAIPKSSVKSPRKVITPEPKRISSTQLGRFTSSKESLRSMTSCHSTEISTNFDKRKRFNEKPRTIAKTPIKKPETIRVNVEDVKRKPKEKRQSDRNGRNNIEMRKRKIRKSENDKEPTLKSDGENVPSLTIEQIKRHHEATRSDNFFQNLFLRDTILTPSQSSTLGRSFIHERAKLFQEKGQKSFKSEPSLKSLNIYLTSKRPVSNSRFRNWERESLSSRSSSPYQLRSISLKTSRLNGYDEFGSSSSLPRGRNPDFTEEIAKERSHSEPPLRLSSDNSILKSSRSNSPSPVRSPSCRRIQIMRQVEKNDNIAHKKTRARSAGEADEIKKKRDVLESNFAIRSTSFLCPSPIDREDYHQYVVELLHGKRKSRKYKELHDFYASLERMGELEKTTSTGDLRPRLKNEEIIDYDRWKEVRSKEKAERELKNIYGKLIAIQRDKDFVFTVGDIDKYRWHGDCGLRCKERSVENIKQQFQKMRDEETDSESNKRRDIAFRKDVYKPLWRGSTVINCANSIQKKVTEKQDIVKTSDYPNLQRNLGGSKKFWSSLSIEQVTALKNQLNEIYGNDNSKPKINPNESLSEKKDSPMRISRRDELDRVVKCEGEFQPSNYEIIVPPPDEFGDNLPSDVRGLHVRCHSMIVDEKTEASLSDTVFKRSGSISRGTVGKNVIPVPPAMPMSEDEKKKLSQSLGRAVLDKMTNKRTPESVPRETRGAAAAALASEKVESDFLVVLTPNNSSPVSKQRAKIVLEKWSEKSPTIALHLPKEPLSNDLDSNTESSETSVRTVVQRSSESDEVPKIVEFFESIEHRQPQEQKDRLGKLSTSQSFANLKELFGERETAKYSTLPFYGGRARSNSPRGVYRTRGSASPSPEAHHRSLRFSSRDRAGEMRSQSVSPCRRSDSTCSLESLWLRSTSPDPERYWRAYLKLAKTGTVRRLKARFESAEELRSARSMVTPTPKRFQSDPELTRNFLKKADESKSLENIRQITDVGWLRRKYEPRRISPRRRGESPPISRVPLRLEDLSMPHINVISKTAELKDTSGTSVVANSMARRAETEELEANRPVGRIRRKFEALHSGKTSILGEMFTSTPDFHELRDITPYLTGRWVAHRYPSRRDNMRSLSSPPDLDSHSNTPQIECPKVTGKITKETKKKAETSGATSVSLTSIKNRTPASILKHPQTDIFANQAFDPSKHRPRYRYQPPPPPPSPSPMVSRPQIKRYWPRNTTYAGRPTVTFEGPDLSNS